MQRSAITRALVIGGVIGGSLLAAAEALADEAQHPISSVLDQPPYPGITVLSRDKGDATWQAAIPAAWRKLREIIAQEPAQIETPFYQYEGAEGLAKENIHRHPHCIVYDDNRCVAISIASRFAADTGVGFPDEKLWFRVSTDGGVTWDQERPIIERGKGFSPMHPNKYVWVGKNGFETAGGWIARMSNGQILFPFCYAPLDENGKYYNPLGGYTFSYVACLIGTWNEAGNEVIWDVTQDVRISAGLASRGVSECAPVELKARGHVLIVSRGGNAPNTGTQKACHWKTLSTDYGKTWSEYTPFTYDDGEEFLTPASFSNAIRSSKTGKAYWVGNISRTMPNGGRPRYPLVIGEIDEEKLGLRKETATIIDDREPDDPPGLQLSNFGLIEDPQTGHILVRLNRSDFRKPQTDAEGVRTYVVEVN